MLSKVVDLRYDWATPWESVI